MKGPAGAAVSGETEDLGTVSKKQKLHPSTVQIGGVQFFDIPSDCLHQIFRDVVLDLSCYDILDLFTVSKFFYKVCQDPSIHFHLFEFLFSSEFGKQIPFKKQKDWKNYFQLFFDLRMLQSIEYESKKNTKNISKEKFILSSITIHEFNSNNEFLIQLNSILKKQTRIESMDQTRYRIKQATILDIDSIQQKFNISLDKITEIDLTSSNIFTIPSSIGLCVSLKTISMSSCNLVYLSPEIGNCNNLEKVDFSLNGIKKLPKEIGQWKNIKSVDFCYNKIKKIPKEIGNWENVVAVDFRGNQIEKLPKSINNWREILKCNFGGNKIVSVPNTENWKKLESIYLCDNKISELPDYWTDFLRLFFIDCSHNPLTKLPPSLPNKLKVFRCSLTEIQGRL